MEPTPAPPRPTVYPRLIEDDVYLCGFTSPKSYGAISYFIRHPDGNWLVDSPRWEPLLVDKFAALGGLRHIFLTHQDDVADADLYARRFQAERIIHEADRRAAPDAERLVRGTAPLAVKPDFLILPVPGHTRGHCVLAYKNKFLFTGDHLEWDSSVAPHTAWGATPGKPVGGLNAYRDYCWYSWDEQMRSMKRLLDVRFEWVLPGHGGRHKLPADEMHAELERFLAAQQVK